jgi:hypothetical protein
MQLCCVPSKVRQWRNADDRCFVVEIVKQVDLVEVQLAITHHAHGLPPTSPTKTWLALARE